MMDLWSIPEPLKRLGHVIEFHQFLVLLTNPLLYYGLILKRFARRNLQWQNILPFHHFRVLHEVVNGKESCSCGLDP
jgi:hypothetical protein